MCSKSTDFCDCYDNNIRYNDCWDQDDTCKGSCGSACCIENWYRLLDYYLEKTQQPPRDIHEEIDYYLKQRTMPIYQALRGYVGEKILIITQATPPAGKPPHITGKLLEVNTKILKLRLKSEHESTMTKDATYSLESIIGFIPMGEGESGGCGSEKETSPLIETLQGLVGKRAQLIIKDSSVGSTDTTGVVLEVTNTLVKMQLDQTSATTEPLTVTYALDSIGGVVALSSDKMSRGKGSKGGKGGKGDSKGEITVQVTVGWSEESIHPEEVNVTFIRDDIATTLRTQSGVVTFITQATGDFIIQGEAVPGFSIPIKQIRITPTTPFVYETLYYEALTIPVEGINLVPSSVTLLPTETTQLVATVLPVNANNQEIEWTSDASSIASVDTEGEVTANSKGTALITAKTVEKNYMAYTTITVAEVFQIIQIAEINALREEVVTLPKTVSVYLNDREQTVRSVPVVWSYQGTSLGETFTIPSQAEASYVLQGSITQSSLTTSLTILVDLSAPVAIPVEGIRLNTTATSMYVGDEIRIIPLIVPEKATNQSVIWESSDSHIATVSDGFVTAKGVGFAIITATTVDGDYKAYCQISVSAVPEIDLIYPTQNVFSSREEVTIDVSNLVKARVKESTLYYIKVEQTGNQPLLGSGSITLSQITTEFKLYYFAPFEQAETYNNQYYVYMSTDPSYPKSDEQTLSTNFKINPAVPTVPPENVKIDLTIVGGSLENKPEDIIFILAREIDKAIETITWQDYVVDPNVPDDQKQFTDEVKLKGKTNAEGKVEWDPPKESLKLGGYVLLEVTPKGYIDNLNLINPDSADGDLLKVVHLTRDGIVVRHVVNTFSS